MVRLSSSEDRARKGCMCYGWESKQQEQQQQLSFRSLAVVNPKRGMLLWCKQEQLLWKVGGKVCWEGSCSTVCSSSASQLHLLLITDTTVAED